MARLHARSGLGGRRGCADRMANWLPVQQGTVFSPGPCLHRQQPGGDPSLPSPLLLDSPDKSVCVCPCSTGLQKGN